MTVYHSLELYAENGEIRPRLVCIAPPDAPCRKQPSVERDSWNDDDPDLTPGHQCWAIEWIEAIGFEDGAAWGARDGIITTTPVSLSYNGGVEMWPVDYRQQWVDQLTEEDH